MSQLLVILIVGVAFANAKEEPFSIGLGVLSPSYTQTVGKENVKVQFDQKDDGGFSYSVGDPASGTNSYLSFGGAPAAPSPYAAPQAAPSPYTAPQAAPSPYAAPSYSSGAGYAAAAPAYNGGQGYAAPAPAYIGAAGYKAPSQPSFSSQGNGFYGGHQAAARKPEEGMGSILPAGFSYHATDGQAFLGSMGESPTFMVEDSSESARGPAEQSFYHNAGGFGQDGLRGDLPIGGYAGPQYQGAHREHGGHN